MSKLRSNVKNINWEVPDGEPLIAKVEYLNGFPHCEVLVIAGDNEYGYPSRIEGKEYIPNRAYALHSKLCKMKLISHDVLIKMGLVKHDTSPKGEPDDT